MLLPVLLLFTLLYFSMIKLYRFLYTMRKKLSSVMLMIISTIFSTVISSKLIMLKPVTSPSTRDKVIKLQNINKLIASIAFKIGCSDFGNNFLFH
jgi:hypothetical protein